MKKQGADVIGAKAGAKPKKPYIQKDTIGSTQNAEIVYGIGDGENGGLINGLSSIILDGTRVIGSSGEVNFNEVKYEERFGLIDQPPLKLIEDTITERGLNLEVRSAAPVVSSFNNKDVDKFVVRISVPSLMQNKDNGDSVAATISYAIDISVDGGAYQTVVEASATEKITDGYEFDHEIEAPEGTQRAIRVRRTTPDSTSQLLIDKFYVAAISEVINAKFSHPTLHHIGLVFNAEQFNNIPKVVFHYYGRKIKVPVNYNPTTRQYDGIWNGTFKVVYSNNPAWVLFDILTDRRSGLGRRIPVELVDKWELYRIAQYCDELVPDGDGGMEPRFVCNNLVLNSKQDAYQVLKDIASIFRGQSFWNGSQVVTVADAPRDIDYAISMASVISYSYSGTARNARHNVVKVQYYDKNNDNSAAYEYATDYDSIRETEQINEVEIRAFGCTSAGQAQRLARYTLLSEQTETRILTAKLSMDAFVNMQIGDVFAWSDKFLAGANNGGRVVAVNGAVLTLDRDVTDSALVGDTLFVNTTSGKASTRTITAINGNKVTLDAVMSTTEPEFVWVIDSAELSLLYFKLDDYKVNPAEGTVDIVGIQHVNSKFGTIDSETALEAPPFSKVEIETLRAPGNVITSFNVRVDQGINIADLYVSWGQVRGATRYTVEFRRDSQAWRVLGNVTGLTHTIENVSAGIYEVRVRAADSIGNLSPYGFSAPINVAGIVLPPPKLASFTAVGKLLAIETKWTFPAGTEASLAVVIEHANQDPANVGVPTQKVNIPYPQSSYTFTSLGAHAQMWFRAAIVDKYGQEGEFTAWTTATADADPEELIDLISGHISEGTLDQTLKGKIDGAGALAGEAQTLANQAKTAAANAQTTANNAGTAAADAAAKATAAANAAAKEATDRATAIAAEAQARTAGLTKEATDRAAALTTQANTLKADSAAKVKALKDEVDPKITTLQNGITQVTTDYKAADTLVVGQLNAYKTSNDSAVASVLQKAESAVSTGSTNSSAITAINGQITALNGTLSTKLDASVISGYYTKGQTDAKAAEIAAGKVEEFNASLVIGGTNLYSGTTAEWQEVVFGGWQSYLHDLVISPNSSLNEGDVITWSGEVLDELNNASLMLHFVVPSNPLGYIQRHSSVANAGEKATVKGTTAVPVGATAVRMALRHDNGNAPSSAFKFRRLQIEKGSRVTDWSPSPQDTRAALDANSTAIQNTNAEVSRVDGVATAANNATTALSGRVSAVEGAVSTKAEAAALTALTTRVGNAEGVNTSQGTAITTLQNTVNHATTGLATKASTSALTATNSEVSRVNGVVTGHANQLTQLASDITAINGTLATKANASALNDIYTKTQADAKATEIAAGEVSKYDASLVIGGTNFLRDGNFTNDMASWGRYGSIVNITFPMVNGKKYARIVNTETGVYFKGISQGISAAPFSKGDDFVVSFEAFTDLDVYQSVYLLIHQIGGGNNDPQLNKLIVLSKTAKRYEAAFKVAASKNVTGFTVMFHTTPNQASDIHITDIMLQRGTRATAYVDSTVDIQAALDANATAIDNTNTEVARVDGRVTTESGRITSLTGRVSTVENGLALKADASALSSLTTRVETEEGKSTSQGTAITALQNTVNHATTGLSTKASSAALTTVDNRVTAVDGRVNTTNSNVATLTGRVSTVEGAVATKADVSAVNALNTRVGNVEGGLSTQASDITALNTSLTTVKRDNLLSDFLDLTGGGANYLQVSIPLKQNTYIALGRKITVKGKLSFKHTGTLTASQGLRIFLGGNISFNGIDLIKQGDDYYFDTMVEANRDLTFNTLNFYFMPSGTANASTQTTVHWAELYFGDQTSKVDLSGKADASALTTTNTEVSRINGVVAGHATQLTNLTTSIAGKADAAALSSLTTRVAAEEGKSTSQGTAITNLENSVNNATTGLASKASSQALTTLNNQVQHSTTGLSAVNTKVDNLKATVENTTNGLASKASSSALDTLSNKVNHSTTGLDAIASKTTVLESAMEVVGTTAPTSSKELDLTSLNSNTYYPVVFALSGNTRTRIQISTPLLATQNGNPAWGTHSGGFSCMYDWETNGSGWWSQPVSRTILTADHLYSAQPPAIDIGQLWNSSREYIFLRGGAKYTARYSNAVASTQIVTASTTFVSQVIAPKAYDASKVIGTSLNKKASSSAVESLTTRVGTAEGKIDTEAGKLLTLSTTVGGHTTTINSQTTSINGIRGVHALKFETNGVISGYGLVSELVNGTVKSQFGVNANNFFIGAPSSNKKPFIVYTSPGLINGVTVPAGTYIDTAFIGAATIGTAHIRDLNVTTAKIGNGQITTAKIGNAQVDTLQIAGEAVTVPTSISNENSFTANYTQFNQVPHNFEDNLAYWENLFGTIATVTLNRTGGKVRFDATLSYADHKALVFWGQSPSTLTSVEANTARAVMSIYRGATLVGRAEIAPTGFGNNNTPLFQGTYNALAIIDDSNITGTVTYTLKFGFSNRLARGGRVVWSDTTAFFTVRSPRLIATEMKR